MQLIVGKAGLSAVVAASVTAQPTSFLRHGSGGGGVAGISLPLVCGLFSAGDRSCDLPALLRLP